MANFRHTMAAKRGRPDMTHAPWSSRIFFERGFMSHKFLSSMLLAFVLFGCPALAQPGPAPGSAASDALTPDQAKRALETLQDDTKRAQIIDTLRAIAKISPDKISTDKASPDKV